MGRPRPSLDAIPEAPESQLAWTLSRLVDPETGIIRSIFESAVQADEPPLHIGVCEFSDPARFPPQTVSDEEWQQASVAEIKALGGGTVRPSGRQHATGAAIDRLSALWATVGEACERYAMHLPAASRDMVLACEDALPGPFVSPNAFVLFSDDQYDNPRFPFKRYKADTPIYWHKTLHLQSGREVFLPAQFVIPMAKDEPQLLDALYSTGCAAGASPAHAVSTGLREAIERDAFMFYWLTRTSPPQISIEHAEAHAPAVIRKLLRWGGVDLKILWLQTDHSVPVIMCMMFPKWRPGVALGASCHLDWRVALEKALVEAFHTLNWIVDLHRWKFAPPAPERVIEFRDHVGFYLAPERRKMVSFLLNGEFITPEPGDLDFSSVDHRAQTREMVSRLQSCGLETYCARLTPDDLASIGIDVARVVTPGLHPLHSGFGMEHLDRRRLEQIAAHLRVACPERLNHGVHPFP